MQNRGYTSDPEVSFFFNVINNANFNVNTASSLKLALIFPVDHKFPGPTWPKKKAGYLQK